MRDRGWIQVWDPVIRVFHWSLVAAFVIAQISAEEFEDVHTIAGYFILGLVTIRVLWGLVGPENARFGHFIHRPAAVMDYVRGLIRGHAEHIQGHNPLGGWMILTLLVWLVLAGLTGWLSIQPDYQGSEWVEAIHELFGNSLMLLVGVHILGVIIGSLFERQNLVAAMWHGKKRAPMDSQ